MIPGNKLGILLLSRFYLGRHTFDQHTIETTYTGTNMRRVLHVGPCNTPGGMAKVIEILSKNPPEGWTADSLNSHSSKGFLSKVTKWREAKKFLKKNIDDYDIIHIHSAADWSYWRKLSLANIATGFGKPVVFHIHSGKFDEFAHGRKNIKNQIEKFTTVVLTNYWQNKLQPIIGKVSVIENPIDPCLRNNDEVKKKPKQILLLGRKDPVKGHKFAFELIRLMRDDGWHLKATGTLYSEESIQGLGWVSEEEKYSLLNESDVLIIPSEFEGQPLVMMEGLAAKCKVVASNKIPGLPSCVVSAEFNNLEDWMRKIKTSDENDATKYIEDHDVKKVSEKWGELYNSLVT